MVDIKFIMQKEEGIWFTQWQQHPGSSDTWRDSHVEKKKKAWLILLSMPKEEVA